MSSSIGRMHLTSKFCSLKVSVSTEFSAGEAPWKNLTGCFTATWWPTMGQCQARSWTSHHLVPSAHVLGWEVLGHGWAWLFPGPRKWTQNCNGDMLEMCLFYMPGRIPTAASQPGGGSSSSHQRSVALLLSEGFSEMTGRYTGAKYFVSYVI